MIVGPLADHLLEFHSLFWRSDPFPLIFINNTSINHSQIALRFFFLSDCQRSQLSLWCRVKVWS